MSFSDHFKSILGKSGNEKPADGSPPAPENKSSLNPVPVEATPAPAAKQASPTLEEIERLIAEQRRQGETQVQAMEKEIQAVKGLLDKTETQSRNRREVQEQTLTFLQQEAEREIKFLERKLQEDMAAWSRQLTDREKIIHQVSRQAEAGQVEKKNAFAKTEEAQTEQLQRAEQLLKEQETRLAEERQKWRQTLQQKEDELLNVRQELARREADLQADLTKQETQRKAAQELWQTRLKELERQWAEKRVEWETALKGKEEERIKLQATFQEKQTAWQLEQERRIQEMTKRQERATEKLSALKVHLLKETQHWQQLSQTREDQLQQLKVKLLLSESDAKGRIDQAQKVLQEAVSHLSGHVQKIQQQGMAEESVWRKQVEEKDAQFTLLREDIRHKLNALETDFSQRIGTLNSDKEALLAQMQKLKEDHEQAQANYEQRQKTLREEQTVLEAAHMQKMVEENQRGAHEQALLQAQILALETQKLEAEKELAAMSTRWNDELSKRDQAIKDTHYSLTQQEAEMQKRFAQDEEALIRQNEGLRSRVRSIERELLKLREGAERSEQEHTAAIALLEKTHEEKQAALEKRALEQKKQLHDRLEERRQALEQFLYSKKEQEQRIQVQLSAKEKERQDYALRLEQLPKLLADTLAEKKAAIQKEAETLKEQLASEEIVLKQTREEAKGQLQARATQLAALRQSLEQREKETQSDLKAHEQIFETERLGMEREISVAQADVERLRVQWQAQIDKKEKEISALQEAMRRKKAEQAIVVETEEAHLTQEILPLEQQRQTLVQTFEKEKEEGRLALERYEKDIASVETLTHQTSEKAAVERASREAHFQEERIQAKSRLESLFNERQATEQNSKAILLEKANLIDQLKEQDRQQSLVFESKRTELIQTTTAKTHLLQDQLRHAEIDLENAREQLPLDLKQKESLLAALNKELAQVQAEHVQRLGRLDRALATLARRGKAKEDVLRAALQKAKEENAAKIAAKDSEIAALQSNLLGQETERQGELDRLAKQFAEERFKLEKSKEDLEWKLKDQKEVAERQLAARRKEIQVLETEVQHIKAQRDEDLAKKNMAFEAEKNKIQAGLAALQTQVDEDRTKQERAIAAREEEMQTLLMRSKERLRILGEEFNQKVGLWKSTNEMLRSQLEQMKGHLAQSQDQWEVMQKEKANEMNGLRQELSAWEVRIQSDAQALERAHEQERQGLLTQIHRQENELEEMRSQFARQLAEKEDILRQSQEDIQNKEASAELEWQSSLDQWQKNKQELQQEKSRLEKELQDLRRRTESEIQHMEDTAARLRMELAFKESEMANQHERMVALREKDVVPLEDRLREVSARFEEEKRVNDSLLRRKDDDIRVLQSRLAIREKRLQDETKRRAKEIEGLQKQVSEEETSLRTHFAVENERLERLRQDQESALKRLTEKEAEAKKAEHAANQEMQETLRRERHDLEDSLRLIERERKELQQQKVALLFRLNSEFESRDQAMEELRNQSRQLAETLRKRVEILRQTRQAPMRGSASNAGAWNAFEQGVHYYQEQNWKEAARAFELCLSRDPRWGAAYQYLALSYHAQGDKVRAAEVAQRALREDPGNSQLGDWIERLRTSIESEKKVS